MTSQLSTAGVQILLRDGRRVQVDDLTVSRAKHIRRVGAPLGIVSEGGQKLRITGRDIKKIIPLA